MQKILLFIFHALLITVAVARWKPDPPPVDPEDAISVESHPVHIAARKMAKLMVNQDVVTTCRYMLFKRPLPFHEARDSCRSLQWPITNKGIELASVQNQEENSDIVSLLRLGFGVKFDHTKPYKYGNWAYIGLSKRYNNDRNLKDDEKGIFNPEDWYYTTNVRANFSHFHREMPDQQSKGKGANKQWQNWIQVNRKGRWDDTYASKSLPYVCEYCGKYIVLSKHVKWSKAKEHCENFGLEFATVNSKEDNDELLFAAKISLGEELGGRRFNNSNWVWIGEMEVISDSGEGTEEWIHHDGTEIPFNFSPLWYKRPKNHQPDNWTLSRGEQKVVAFSRENGHWDDSFPHKKRPFACMCPERNCHFK